MSDIVWQVVGAACSIVLMVWVVRLEAKIRSMRGMANPAAPEHKKYIGLDEYRARQQRQRYRDRVL